MIVVTSWGVAGSWRDAGAEGRAQWGVPRGGAADRWSLDIANRLVGNTANAPGFESSGGLAFTVTDHAIVVAVAGGVATLRTEGGPAVAWGTPTVLPAGCRIRIERLTGGARLYVAVRGGLQPTADGTGTGARFVVGADPATALATQAAVRRPAPGRLDVWPGPRLDWFHPDSWHALCNAEFVASAAADRVGVRLDGPSLVRTTHRELPPEGLVEGAIQVPPDGRPVVMLADHPTTGGYPVIAVVDPGHVRHVAQLAPGASIRFRAAPGSAFGGS